LRHRCLESPSADCIYRLTATAPKGTSRHQLPEYFDALCEDAQVFCSSNGSFAQGYGHVEGNEVVLVTSKAAVFNLMVVGTRKDPAAQEDMALGVEYEEAKEVEGAGEEVDT
jgi:hypothetical protein